IVWGKRPPVAIFVTLGSFIETLFGNGGAQERTILRREIAVEPVIADRQGVGHFCDVEEMRRIPVSERSSRSELRSRAVAIILLPAHPIHERQRVDALQAQPALRQHVSPGNLMRHRRLVEYLVSLAL